MATEKYSNNGNNTLNGAINNSVTTIIVNSSTSFPSSGNFRILIDSELILVGTVSGATFTNCTRGIENTTAASHSNAAAVTHILTAGSLNVNPRSMSNTGDIEYLNSSGNPTSLSAPADGSYAVTFASGVPTYTTISSLGSVPTGSISMFGGTSAPTGYQMCDGSAILRATFSALFAVLGTTYGVGDGITTFNLPDLRQRFPLGKAASGTGNVLGATGGLIDHTHTYSQVLNHTHPVSISDPGHDHTVHGIPGGADFATFGSGAIIQFVTPAGYISPGTATTGISASTTNPSGGVSTGTTAIQNPPYVTVNYIIKT